MLQRYFKEPVGARVRTHGTHGMAMLMRQLSGLDEEAAATPPRTLAPAGNSASSIELLTAAAQSPAPPSPTTSSSPGGSHRLLVSHESAEYGSGRRLTASGRRLDYAERPHSTSHRSSSGRSQFFRANSTPSVSKHAVPWGHTLNTLSAWSANAKGTVDELLKLAPPPLPEARATFLVVFDTSLTFDIVLEALTCHAQWSPGSESFFYLIKQLAPKQQNVDDVATTVGELLFVTANWADKRPFENPALVAELTSFDLQSHVECEEMRVSVCMPKPEFDKTMAAWQTKHGSSIKTHIIPSLIRNAACAKLASEVESHLIVVLGLWFLNLPMFELLKMDKSKAHNQISKQARIMQTLTASLVDQGRLQDAEMICKLMLRRNAFLWPDAHQDVISVNLQTMGDIYMHMGNKPDAIMAYQQSLAIDLQLLKAGHADTNPAVVSEGLKTVASLLLELGRYEEAEGKLKQALQIDCDLYAKTKPVVVVESLYHVGAVLEQQKRYADAALYFSDALVVNATVHGSNSSQVVRNLRTLVQLYDQAGKTQQVEHYLLRLLAVLVNRGQAIESGPVLDALARISLTLDKFDAAIMHATRAIEIDAQAHGRLSPEVGKDLTTLARIHFAYAAKLAREDPALKGVIAEAERRSQQAAYVHQKLAEKEMRQKALVKKQAEYTKLVVDGAAGDARAPQLSALAFDVASLHLALAQTKEAIEVFSAALRLLRKAKGATDAGVLHDTGDLAKLMFENGQFKAASELYLDSAEAYTTLQGAKHVAVGTSLFNLAVCLEALGFEQRVKQLAEFSSTLDDAQAKFAMALDVFSTASSAEGARLPETAVCVRRLYELLWNRGKMEQNRDKLLEACAVFKRALAMERNTQQLAALRLHFCRLLLDAGLYEDVLAQCAQAKTEMDASPLLEESGPMHAMLLNNIADVHFARGEYVEAEAKVREALKTLQSTFGAEHRQVAVFAGQHLVPILLRRAAVLGKDDVKRAALLDEAEDVAQAGLHILVKAYGNKSHADVCEALLTHGAVLLDLGNYSAAENVFIEAFEMAKALYGPDVGNPLVSRAFEALQDVWSKGEDDDEATDGDADTEDAQSKLSESRHSRSSLTSKRVGSGVSVTDAATAASQVPLRPTSRRLDADAGPPDPAAAASRAPVVVVRCGGCVTCAVQ